MSRVRSFGAKCGPICKAGNLMISHGQLRRMPYLFGLAKCNYCDVVLDYFGTRCPCCIHTLRTRPFNLKKSFYSSHERKVRYEIYLRFKSGEIDYKELLFLESKIDNEFMTVRM